MKPIDKALNIQEKTDSLLNEIKESLYPILEKKGYKIDFKHNYTPAQIVFDTEYGVFFLKVEGKFNGRFEEAPLLLLSSAACEVLQLADIEEDQ